MDECKPLRSGGGGHPRVLRAQQPEQCGRAVQVKPMKSMLKTPVTKCLKLKCNNLLSNFAFNFNLRRYNVGVLNTETNVFTTIATTVGWCRLKPVFDGGKGESLVPPHTCGSVSLSLLSLSLAHGIRYHWR